VTDQGTARWWRQHWFALVCAHAILLQTVTFILRPMTSFRAIELGVPVFWLGALSACFAIVPLLVAIPSGRAIDRVGERPVMLAGGGLLIAASLAYIVGMDSLLGLAIASVILGTGQLLAVVGEQALVANAGQSSTYDTLFGKYTLAASVGQAAGPIVIILVGGSGAFPDAVAVFAAATGISFALFVLTLFIESQRRPVRISVVKEGGGLRLLRSPGILRALIASSIILSAVDLLVVYLPALGTERGLSAAVVGGLLAIRSVASMASRFLLGRLATRLGRRRTYVLSCVAAGITIGLLVVPQPIWSLAVLVAVAGFALGIGQPLTMSWLAEAAPLGQRGVAMSLRLTGNRLGQILIPTTVGIVAGSVGVGAVLAVTAGALGGAALSVRGVRVDVAPEPD